MISISKMINRIPAESKASVTASLASSVAYGACAQLNRKSFQNFEKVTSENRAQNLKHTKLIKKIASRILKDRQLAQKGVKIIDVNKTPIEGELPKNILKKLEEYKQGKNSVFLFKPILYRDGKKYIDANTILIDGRTPPLALLHEIGHADNYNNSKVLKTLLKLRDYEPQITYAARTWAIRGKNNDSKAWKVFMHKNSTLMSLLAQIPTLTEEGMASLKAIRWLKQYSGNKKLAKQLEKELGNAYLTYLTNFLTQVTSVQTAKVTKDKILQKFETKI